RLAVADVNGDAVPDLVIAAGSGSGPLVTVVSGLKLFGPQAGAAVSLQPGDLLAQFFAYDPRFFAGVYIDAGDYDGDGRADILTGPGVGGGPHVRIFSGATGLPIANFLAFPPSAPTSPVPGESTFTGGVGGVAFFADDIDGIPNDIIV